MEKAKNSDVPIVDRSVFERYKSAFGERLIDLFLETVPSSIKRIDFYVAEKEPAKIKNEAHSLKGSCSVIGAHQMATVCHKIQIKGDSNDLDHMEELTLELKQSYQKVVQELISLQ